MLWQDEVILIPKECSIANWTSSLYLNLSSVLALILSLGCYLSFCFLLFWQAQPWYPLLLSLVIQRAVRLPTSTTLII